MVRDKIVHDYAKWTSLSALRSGDHVKARDHIYPALDSIDFDCLFDTDDHICEAEFNYWHERTVADLRQIQFKTNNKSTEWKTVTKHLNVGWAAKMINVYLKTRSYVGGYGRKGLRDVIHPPLDGELAKGLKNQFPDIGSSFEGFNIKNITSYSCYQELIQLCRAAAKRAGCSLIEVDQFWEGTQSRDTSKYWIEAIEGEQLRWNRSSD